MTLQNRSQNVDKISYPLWAADCALESKSILFNKFGHYLFLVGQTIMQHMKLH
jgi:hypothetical protein